MGGGRILLAIFIFVSGCAAPRPEVNETPAWPDEPPIAWDKPGCYRLLLVDRGRLPDAGFRLFTAEPDGSDLRKIFELSAGWHLIDLAVSPDGTSAAATLEDRFTQIDLHEIDLAAGSHRSLTGTDGDEWWVKWHPSGEHVLFRQGRQLVSLRLSDLTVTPLVRGIEGAWSPNGHALAYVDGSDEGPNRLLVGGKGKESVLHASDGPIYSPAWGPEGDFIYFLEQRFETFDDESYDDLMRIDLDGGSLRKVAALDEHSEGATCFDLSKAGDIGYGVTIFNDYEYVNVLRSGQLETLNPRGPFDALQTPTWAPDGNELFYAHLAEKRTEVRSTDGNRDRLVVTGLELLGFVACAPNR